MKTTKQKYTSKFYKNHTKPSAYNVGDSYCHLPNCLQNKTERNRQQLPQEYFSILVFYTNKSRFHISFH